MAVSSAVALPNQPTSGKVHIVPLGGDGFVAPHSMYTISDHAVTGDGTGGAATLDITLDDRHCSLVGFVQMRVAQATPAAADMRLLVFSLDDNFSPAQIFQQSVDNVAATVNSSTVAFTWAPVPFLFGGGPGVGTIRSNMTNVDTDVYRLSAIVYQFDIRVRETTAMGPLLWARGST